ncbi:hypothetical protein JKP88DRAFT_328158, partial [Tribonema minus]
RLCFHSCWVAPEKYGLFARLVACRRRGAASASRGFAKMNLSLIQPAVEVAAAGVGFGGGPLLDLPKTSESKATKALRKTAITAAAEEEAHPAAAAHARDTVTVYAALVQHLHDTYPDDVQGKRVHVARVHALARALLVLNFPPRRDGGNGQHLAPAAINPVTGTTLYCRTFAFLARQLGLTPQQFQDTYAIVDVFPVERPSRDNPHRGVRGLATDDTYRQLSAGVLHGEYIDNGVRVLVVYVVAVRVEVASNRGCRIEEVEVFVLGAPAKRVCECLTVVGGQKAHDPYIDANGVTHKYSNFGHGLYAKATAAYKSGKVPAPSEEEVAAAAAAHCHV